MKVPVSGANWWFHVTVCVRLLRERVFPSTREREAIEGATRDWTLHMILRSLVLSYSCVEIVKILLGYPPLNWIATTARPLFPFFFFYPSCGLPSYIHIVYFIYSLYIYDSLITNGIISQI